jgi:hypothetical protein
MLIKAVILNFAQVARLGIIECMYLPRSQGSGLLSLCTCPGRKAWDYRIYVLAQVARLGIIE